MTNTKPITRDQERQLISFLANSDEVATLAKAHLENRMTQRNQELAELAVSLPAAEKACALAVADAEGTALALSKARDAYVLAEKKHLAAAAQANGLTNRREHLKMDAYRKAAELADPRIDDLRRWVSRLHNAVRCEPLEDVLRISSGFGWGNFLTSGVPVEKANQALTRLESIEAELRALLVSTYGAELPTTLNALQLEAEALARSCIPSSRLDDLMGSRPDLDVLPLPTV